MGRKYVLGLDFGTESGRALLVAVDNGEELATSVVPYAHGVIDTALPGTGQKLPPDWALQHPADYLAVLDTAVPDVLRRAGVQGDDIIGIGVDFTACTVVPIDSEAKPLCLQPEWAENPHAWVKLWKHHGAHAQAERLSAAAAAHAPELLKRYGGAISSEWLFPKMLEVFEAAPEVYAATDRFIEAGDWIVLLLCGEEKRNACAAGYKACWDGTSYPPKAMLRAANAGFENVVAEKIRPGVFAAGVRAGSLLPAMAERLGLRSGIAVATAGIDAHVAVPSSAVGEAGKLVLIMGTSLCHMVCGPEDKLIPGISGVVKDGILPGLYGFEAGQAAVGDIFAWFVKHCVPASVHEAAAQEGIDVHVWLAREAAGQAVGEHGLVCLDWWNGNRSVLADPNLSGMIVGLTLSTTPAEIYRALLESTAFGTYTIVRALEAGGCPIDAIYACGGMPGKNPLLMQIFSDVTGREIRIAASDQTVALGSAMWAAVAAGREAGGYADIGEAITPMARLRDTVYRPDASNHAKYQELYALYSALHDHFGRGGSDAMQKLKELRRAVRGA